MELLNSYVFFVFVGLGLIAIIRSVLFWLNFIQIKQYRADRVLQELKSKSFYKLVLSPYRLILIILFITWEVIMRTTLKDVPHLFDTLFYAITAYLFVNALLFLKNIVKGSLQRPKFTKKVIAFFGIIAALELVILSLYKFWPEQFLLIEILQPIIVIATFYVLFSPNLFLHKRLKDRARKKRSQFKDLIVIGITGSFGKTTMKEYLYSLLSQKFKVLKTPDHINVDTGIAKQIIDELDDSYDIYIVEMGAYKVGEIKSICDIVLPTHAIMTGLSNQHLELFGSQANITSAKFELVDAVKDPQQIVAYRDHALLVEAFKKRGIDPIWYGTTDDHLKITETVKSMVFGKAQVFTLVGAALMAKEVGLPLDLLQKANAYDSLPQIEGTMEQKIGTNKSVVIDDSYNANTFGVLTALDDLKESGYKKRIFVFKNILELGEDNESDHIKIAEKISESATHLLLLDGPEKELMSKHLFGVKNIEPSNLLDLLDEDTIVIFEGRGTQLIMAKII